jgi:hypothetical protein
MRDKTRKQGGQGRMHPRKKQTPGSRPGRSVKASSESRGSPGPPLPRPLSGDLCQRPERRGGGRVGTIDRRDKLQRRTRRGLGIERGQPWLRRRCTDLALGGWGLEVQLSLSKAVRRRVALRADTNNGAFPGTQHPHTPKARAHRHIHMYTRTQLSILSRASGNGSDSPGSTKGTRDA